MTLQDPKQIFNKEGALCHHGISDSRAGDLQLPASNVYYCGRKKNQCRCGNCNGQCGPTNGCPCNACVELVGFIVEDGKLVKAAVAGSTRSLPAGVQALAEAPQLQGNESGVDVAYLEARAAAERQLIKDHGVASHMAATAVV